MSYKFLSAQTIKEATSLYKEYSSNQENVRFYSGGTEIITLERMNKLPIDTVIDIKNIPACMIHQMEEEHFVFGAGISLTQLELKNYFPLLTEVSKEIADRTARNKITLGGNVCGTLFYREAVLPLLLTNSVVVFASEEKGIRTDYIQDTFDQTMNMEDSELLVQVFVERRYATFPYVTIKHRQQWKTGYPLLTVTALKVDGKIRMAFSGLCPYPFRSNKIENILNESSIAYDTKIHQVIENLPSPILNDTEGSSSYRLFVLQNTVMEILQRLEGM